MTPEEVEDFKKRFDEMYPMKKGVRDGKTVYVKDKFHSGSEYRIYLLPKDYPGITRTADELKALLLKNEPHRITQKWEVLVIDRIEPPARIEFGLWRSRGNTYYWT